MTARSTGMTKGKSEKYMRAGLYARVSTHHGQDVGLQLDELHQVAAQRGWQVVEVFKDEGISGGTSERPALNHLMAAARSGRLDVIAVWKFDRFARSTSHLLQALDEFRLLGVEFVSLREQVDTSTPMGKAMFTIVAAVAELERDLIRERVVAGLDRARRKGKSLGRPRRDVNVDRALQLLEAGRTQRQIAIAMKVPRSTLRRALERHRKASED